MQRTPTWATWWQRGKGNGHTETIHQGCETTMKIWCTDYRDRVFTDAAMRDVERYRGLHLFTGAKLAGRFPSDATLDLRSKRYPSDFVRAGVFWIVSSRLRGILDAHGVEAEYFPVTILCRGGERVSGEWYCFNPTVVADWFDRSRAHFVAESGFATDIETIAVRPGVFGAAPLAVAERTIPDLVGVSDAVAASIEAAGCTGVLFRDPEAWRNPTNPL